MGKTKCVYVLLMGKRTNVLLVLVMLSGTGRTGPPVFHDCGGNCAGAGQLVSRLLSTSTTRITQQARLTHRLSRRPLLALLPRHRIIPAYCNGPHLCTVDSDSDRARQSPTLPSALHPTHRNTLPLTSTSTSTSTPTPVPTESAARLPDSVARAKLGLITRLPHRARCIFHGSRSLLQDSLHCQKHPHRRLSSLTADTTPAVS